MTHPPGRSTEHWRVGKRHRVLGARTSRDPRGALVGVCKDVTYWGSDRVRWVRLVFGDGTEKSYSPRDVVALR